MVFALYFRERHGSHCGSLFSWRTTRAWAISWFHRPINFGYLVWTYILDYVMPVPLEIYDAKESSGSDSGPNALPK
jgi:hypothetical protein